MAGGDDVSSQYFSFFPLPSIQPSTSALTPSSTIGGQTKSTMNQLTNMGRGISRIIPPQAAKLLLMSMLVLHATPVTSFAAHRSISKHAHHRNSQTPRIQNDCFSSTTTLHMNPPFNPGDQSSSNDSNSANNDDPNEPHPIDQFRDLMGTLYGVAGVAHAADCYIGQSQLLVSAGSPPFSDLPPAGQALVALWCVAGPVAYATSRVGGRIADLGLIVYGIVEVGGAAVIARYLSTTLEDSGTAGADIDALMNAVLVQGVVFASWIYSRNKKED